MASNNLRVIYKNLVDVATLYASSSATAATDVTNLKSDIKGLVWRTSTNTSSTSIGIIAVQVAVAEVVNSVVLAYTNLAPGATITVQGHASLPSFGGTINSPTVTAGTVLASNLPALPYMNSGFNYWGGEAYSSTNLREGYARVYFNNTTAYRFYSITISSTDTNVFNYVEVSRLIMGTYWTPRFNTGYGMSTTTVDMSSSERSEAGDLVTSAMPTYSTLSFDLKYMDKTDKSSFQKLIKYSTSKKPIFISLFPENADDYSKEQVYQLYGKLKTIPGLEHPMFEMYSSNIEIEEV